MTGPETAVTEGMTGKLGSVGYNSSGRRAQRRRRASVQDEQTNAWSISS